MEEDEAIAAMEQALREGQPIRKALKRTSHRAHFTLCRTTTVKARDDETFRTRRDPQERDPRLRPVIDAAAQEAEVSLREDGWTIGMGYCHVLWGCQKRILKEKYGINWKTPAEMNPDVRFD